MKTNLIKLLLLTVFVSSCGLGNSNLSVSLADKGLREVEGGALEVAPHEEVHAEEVSTEVPAPTAPTAPTAPVVTPTEPPVVVKPEEPKPTQPTQPPVVVVKPEEPEQPPVVVKPQEPPPVVQPDPPIVVKPEPPVIVKPEPPVVVIPPVEEEPTKSAPAIPSKLPWGDKVSRTLYKNLDDPKLGSLFTVKVRDWDLKFIGCTNFNSLSFEEKKVFYVVFMAAIAERESTFDPRQETKDNIGLVQIDTASAFRHGSAIVDKYVSVEELKDPHLNLYVGAYILRNQLNGKWIPEVANRLFTKRNYYWEVLNSRFEQRILISFNKYRKNVPFCEK